MVNLLKETARARDGEWGMREAPLRGEQVSERAEPRGRGSSTFKGQRRRWAREELKAEQVVGGGVSWERLTRQPGASSSGL